MSTLTCNPRNEKKLTDRRHHFGEWTGRGQLKMPALVTAQGGGVSTHPTGKTRWQDSEERCATGAKAPPNTNPKWQLWKCIKQYEQSVHRMTGSMHPVSPAATPLWFKKHTGRHQGLRRDFRRNARSGQRWQRAREWVFVLFYFIFRFSK